MRYDDDFRDGVLRDLEESGDSVAVVSRRHGIAHSTLVRWREAGAKGSPSGETDANELPPLDWGALSEEALNGVFVLLDRQDVESLEAFRAHLDEQLPTTWWARLVTEAYPWVIVGASALASILSFVPVVDGLMRWLPGSWTETVPTEVVGWALMMALYFLLVSVLTRLTRRFLGRFDSFAFVTSSFAPTAQALVRSISILQEEEKRWRQGLRWNKWRSTGPSHKLRRSLRNAERFLGSRTKLGRSYKTQSAREWELGCRQRVSATLGYVEIMLEQQRQEAVPRAYIHLWELLIMTLMRDWSVAPVPKMQERQPYQKPISRFFSLLWSPISGVALILGLLSSLKGLGWPF